MLDNYDDYKTGGTHKVFSISVVGENITITNEKLRTESIVLDEELCSTSRLKFGSCGTSKFTAEIANVFENFEGKLIEVTVTMDGEITKYGSFKVVSDKPLADRIFRSLKAYDAMNDIINTNVLDWYNGLTFPMTLKNFRDSFFNYLGITQETTTLVNDNFIIPGGFTASDALMGGTIITAICELNGVFGHINRDGKFEYIDLTQSESFECPPYENGSVTYEDYVTSPITKLTMRGTASDVGTSVGVDGNEYIIQGNPLIYGTEGTQALTTAITNLLNKIKTIVFRPFDLRKTIGNPCVELGDAITIDTKYETVNSYVLRRTLTGIQALRDRYSALGSKVYPAEATSYQNEITRSKGKMHEFEVTLEGFSSRVTEVESDVEGLDSDLHTNYSTTTEMNSAIEQSAEGIRTEVSQTYVNQTTYNAEVQRLQNEIDGAIESYTGSAVPTLNNYPANEWTTTIERDKHLGDLYLVNASGGSYAGFYYRFDKSGSTYSWVHIPDNEVQKALADAAEANQKAEAAQATADGIADDLSDNYSTTQQMNSAINQKASEITQTVSTTYETKSDATSKLNTANTNAQGYATQAKNDANAATDSKLTNYYTKTQTDSAITQKANEITLNVSENYTTKTEFGNLEIGGRNLLRRTDYSLYNYANGDYNVTVPSRISFADDRVTIGYGNEAYTRGYAKNKINKTLPVGTKVTCSVYVYEQSIPDGNHRIYCSPITSADGTPTWSNVKVINKDFTGMLTWQYTVPDNVTVYGFVVDFDTHSSTSGQMVLGRVKVELGDKATDWSPAPEDTTSEAQAYASTAETTAKSYTDAQLQITSSSILSTVEQGYTTKTDFNNLQIGGENLFPRKGYNGELFYGSRIKDLAYDDYTYGITATGDNLYVYSVANPGSPYTTACGPLIPIKAGESVYIKIYDMINNTNVFTKNFITLWDANKVSLGYSSFGASQGVYTCPSDKTTAAYMSLRFGYGSAVTDTRYKARVKIERGNKPTDWSPAQEDIDIPGTNLMRYAPTTKEPTAYLAYQIPITEKLIIGQTYTLQLWDINISNSAKQASELNAAIFAGGGYDMLCNVTGYTNGHADYKVVTFTVSTSIARPADLDNLYLNIYNSPSQVSGATMNLTIGRWKLEKGNKATEWQMNPIDVSSKSEVQQLSNMVAVKVNSSGRLVTAALGVDPASATSYFKVKADDIDIISNDNIQLTGKSIGITSTNFSVTASGSITAKAGTIGGWSIESTRLHKTVSSGSSGRYASELKPDQLKIAYAYGSSAITSETYIKSGIILAYGQGGSYSSNKAVIIDGDGQSLGYDFSMIKSFGAMLTYIVPSTGNEVNVNGTLFHTNGNCYVAGALQLGEAASALNCGIDIFGGGAPYIDFHLNHSSADFTARIVHRAASNTNYIDFIASSSIWIDCRAKSFANQSSKYVKDNIKDISDEEAKKILELRPVSFDYKYGGDPDQRGLIAEEVYDILPNMVIGAPKEFNAEEPWDTPSIDYSKFVPYLIKMIQIMQKEIDDLKK